MRFVEDQAPMGQSILQQTSRAPSATVRRDGHDQEDAGRPIQELIARRVSQRARRRLFVAMLPLLFVTAVLAYVLAKFGF